MLQFIAIAASTFISEDLACIAAGSLAAASELSLTSAIAASLVGIVVGDLLLYAAGFLGGRAILRFRIAARYLSPAKLLSAERWFDQRGSAIVVLSRFVPGMRLPTYVAAGVLRMPVLRFFLLLVAAAAVWTPALVAASYYSGASFARQLSEKSSPRFWLAIGLAFFVMWVLLAFARSLFTFKGRRLLYSKWQRLLRWEFWPMWVLYVPVGIYIFYLGIRHRSLTAFTASNPGIPASGIKGESKSEILHQLCPGPRNFGSIAPFARISGGADKSSIVSLVQSHMKKMRLRFPVVLKPDAGERGNGVVIAKSASDIEYFVALTSGDFILQKFIPGREFGVFYFRYPHQIKGEILAITDKRLITLTGDGVSDLETLILKDARAVLMAGFHLEQHKANLGSIITAGAVYPLVNLGTHCKGALFLEGNQFISEKLTLAIDKISKNFDGFYFGRYDIRVPGEADLVAGKNIYVIELNGVTSEATSMYDPRYSIWHAYKTLCRQWKIACEIGAQNIRNGAKPISLRELVQMVL
jgi:membrane protein DedA with SNARE-associated domain